MRFGAESAMLRQALGYLERGWSPVPLLPRGKEPNYRILERLRGTNSYTVLEERPASESEVREWFQIDPSTNIGVLCGKPSGSLVVADFDRNIDLPTPVTPTVRTGRGKHVYLHGPGVGQRTNQAWGELKAIGYVTAPPSIHPNGTTYEWQIGPDQELAPVEDMAELLVGVFRQGDSAEKPSADFPFRKLRNQFTSGPPRPPTPPQTKPPTPHVLLPQQLLEWLVDWDFHLPFVEAVADFCGMSLRGNFHCLIHPERHASANLWRGDNGWIHRCHHERGKPSLTLTQCYATTFVGRSMEDLRGPAHTAWKLRALYRLGFIDPPQLSLPPLPPLRADAMWALMSVWDGLQELFSLKAFVHDEPTTTLSGSFGPAWVHIRSESTFERAKLELLRLGVIEKVGVVDRASVYAPGGSQ